MGEVLRMSDLLRNRNTSQTNISDEEMRAYEERRNQRFYEEWLKETEQKKLEQVERSLDESGLRGAIKEKTFDTFVADEPWQKKAKDICERFAAYPEGWLLLSGPTGCGKTHLCTAVVGTLIKKRIPVRYMLYRDEMSRLKYADKDDRNNMMRTFKTAKALYIDDLFKRGASEAELRIMIELLDFRYRDNLMTIVSTEMSSDELINLDEAIAGRIIEKSTKVLINAEAGRNYRLRKGDKI